MTDLGLSCAENEMEPRVVARHRSSRERRSTSLSEPVRQVVAAWIVAFLVVAAGLSVLAFHERDVCDNGAAVAVPRWHPPAVADAEEAGEIPCRSGIRACSNELPAERDGTDRTITQFRVDSTFLCSSNDHGVSRPAGFHRQPLVEPCVNFSAHTAPIRQTYRSCRSASERRGSSYPVQVVAENDWRGFCVP